VRCSTPRAVFHTGCGKQREKRVDKRAARLRHKHVKMGGEIFASPRGVGDAVFHTACGWFADKYVDNHRDALCDGLVKIPGEKFATVPRCADRWFRCSTDRQAVGGHVFDHARQPLHPCGAR